MTNTSNHVEAVEAKLHSLCAQGAERVFDAYTVAQPGQGEVVLNEHRLFVTPNDSLYQQYVDVMSAAGLPYVRSDESLSDDQVVVGEVPRDARPISEIIRSLEPAHGVKRTDVFRLVGKAIGTMDATSQVMPAEASLSLDRLLVLRKQLSVMFMPPIEFVPSDAVSKQKITERMREEIWPRFAEFGGLALQHAFEAGLSNGTS